MQMFTEKQYYNMLTRLTDKAMYEQREISRAVKVTVAEETVTLFIQAQRLGESEDYEACTVHTDPAPHFQVGPDPDGLAVYVGGERHDAFTRYMRSGSGSIEDIDQALKGLQLARFDSSWFWFIDDHGYFDHEQAEAYFKNI